MFNSTRFEIIDTFMKLISFAIRMEKLQEWFESLLEILQRLAGFLRREHIVPSQTYKLSISLHKNQTMSVLGPQQNSQKLSLGA